MTHSPKEGDVQRDTARRSVVKAISYRVVIVCLDFVAVYLLTGKTTLALGFMVVSNVYTTLGYFIHERIWARIAWGRSSLKESPAPDLSASITHP